MLTLLVLQAEPWSDLMFRLGVLGRSASEAAVAVAVALVVMLVGWAVATLLARLVRGVLRALRFDDAMRRVAGPRATARHRPSDLAGWAVYWTILAFAVLLAFDLLGYPLAASVAERLGEVVPRIVTSALIFAAGVLLAMLVGGITRRFLESAEIRAAKFQGQVVTAVLTGFAALLALEQLGFAAQFVMALGVIAVATAGLGLALAFGLGCSDLARDFLVEYLRSLDDEGRKRPL
jgi:hypothetical protein